MIDYSKRALMDFLETSISRGRINANTGGGIRAACNKILEQVNLDEDIRPFDVKAAITQYNNRHPGELSGDSLRVYESRVRRAIAGFISSMTDPTGSNQIVKPSNGKRSKADQRQEKNTPAKAGGAEKNENETHATAARPLITETSLAIPFPLRPTFLAQVVIPRDLTKDEARRLCAFIEALAQDPPPITS